jgi:hypothetical protein
MKFFEYSNKNGFDYYALIGAKNQEKANTLYKDTIADFNDIEPTEISKEDAKTKLLNSCHDSSAKLQAINDFAIYTNKSQPYMVLFDPSLI